MSKPNRPLLPEAQGVLAATVYINIMFLFIPLPFRAHIIQSMGLNNILSPPSSLSDDDILAEQSILFKRLIPFLAALLSICCMIFLGFADDVLNLRWRHKLILPTLSSLPILMVHIANLGTTHIAVPLSLQRYLGTSVDIGPLYYVYMGMLAVFCTNAINIYAGINGLEAGQSAVIAFSVIVFNLIELNEFNKRRRMEISSLLILFPPSIHRRYLSSAAKKLASYLDKMHACTEMPFSDSNYSSDYFFRCPASIFVGDTFCYFAGMTFAVVGILGHFSKTLMLFFIPQVFNFLLSLPQLFRFIPCPRHRLPLFCEKSNVLYPSTVSVHLSSLSPLGRLCLRILLTLRLTHLVVPDSYCVDLDAKEEADSGESVTIDNLTAINLLLRLAGPMTEARATTYLLIIQVGLLNCLQ
ncbi:unnamed protein product [Rodentolepis nana]|uniref:UDP-N-acetylglucosamine--dolichyl-phosphate N-acetylglucosaminephosphotransferase n=1 Tax=Rodentolepis nana TaxID=102285 RepID=A0A0R3T4B5_RODNA|nr:unnamed protein product [Rodentolepis nana]